MGRKLCPHFRSKIKWISYIPRLSLVYRDFWGPRVNSSPSLATGSLTQVVSEATCTESTCKTRALKASCDINHTFLHRFHFFWAAPPGGRANFWHTSPTRESWTSDRDMLYFICQIGWTKCFMLYSVVALHQLLDNTDDTFGYHLRSREPTFPSKVFVASESCCLRLLAR